jgi:transposase-like protein
MSADLTNPIFNDEEQARKHLELLRWPNGPVCPHCSETEKITKLKGKSHRPGLYQCNACRQPFTVTMGTILEDSHIELHKWLLAFHLMSASKKGISSHQLHRMLGITYKSAWFMAHRIREAMKTDYASVSVLGGKGPVEADETFIGTKPGAKKRKGLRAQKRGLVFGREKRRSPFLPCSRR